MKLVKKYQNLNARSDRLDINGSSNPQADFAAKWQQATDRGETSDPMEETRQRIQDRLNNNTFYWTDADGSIKQDYLTDDAAVEDYRRKSGTATPLNWEFNLIAPARFGLGAIGNGIRTGLQAMNTAFTPSTWLNPVTGAKLLSPTVGTIADAGIQGAFAYEGLNGLYNQGREGTLLSDPASTFMHGLEVLPLAGLGSKAVGMGVDAWNKSGMKALWDISRNNAPVNIESSLAPKTIEYVKREPTARLDFLERNPSRISDAERAGVPKGDRNFKRTENPNSYMQQEANKSFDNINNHSPRRRLVTEEEIDKMSPEAQIHARESKNDFIKRNQDMMEDYFADSYEFNKDLQDYINGLDIETAPQFKPVVTDGIAERNPYVAAYRNYLYNNGTDAMMISDDDIAKFLTHMHNMQQQGVTGKMADKLPLWHGSNDMFDVFDWHNTGKYTGNSGALGPGNYFSSHGATYGRPQRRNNLPKNFQPYYITEIKSTPSGHMMIEKGILPDYMNKQMIQANPEAFQAMFKRQVPGANTTLYIDPSEAVQGVFEGDRAAFMLRRNDGIKSLFPHPSRLIRNEDGTVQLLPTNWSDPRVNFALGGKLIKRKL